jgi:hypothetical protein
LVADFSRVRCIPTVVLAFGAEGFKQLCSVAIHAEGAVMSIPLCVNGRVGLLFSVPYQAAVTILLAGHQSRGSKGLAMTLPELSVTIRAANGSKAQCLEGIISPRI